MVDIYLRSLENSRVAILPYFSFNFVAKGVGSYLKFPCTLLYLPNFSARTLSDASVGSPLILN